jgi:hypothetical protein
VFLLDSYLNFIENFKEMQPKKINFALESVVLALNLSRRVKVLNLLKCR